MSTSEFTVPSESLYSETGYLLRSKIFRFSEPTLSTFSTDQFFPYSPSRSTPPGLSFPHLTHCHPFEPQYNLPDLELRSAAEIRKQQVGGLWPEITSSRDNILVPDNDGLVSGLNTPSAFQLSRYPPFS